ncbi:MAG: excinuclease ABC subunit UvrC [Alphaproteobacteria bacterium]|nr:excinuclease ABC subunit UvrC [Alphaproteobacteria bacterium]
MTASANTLSLAGGIATIKDEVASMSAAPGVYRMLNGAGDVLYVGKARNLKRRVTSYTQVGRLTTRLQRMVAETRQMEVLTTHTEVEALLLEANLIKRYRPRYNILLRDDKSFPYLHMTGQMTDRVADMGASDGTSDKAPRDPADWPYVVKHRGPRTKSGEYYGPYASAGAVNRTLSALERAFLLRSCSDSVFSNRNRPCLKYQLKRCAAPCVGLIGREDYAALLGEARDFLSGRSARVQQRLAADMEAASVALDFEAAGRLRDRIRALTQIQAHQDINVETGDLAEADVIAAHMEGGQTCVQVFFFRAGRNNGNRAYYPKHDKTQDLDEVLAAFIGQFYEDKTPPRLVLTSHDPAERALVAAALSLRAERKVALATPTRGPKAQLVRHARDNARDALARRLAEHRSQAKLVKELAGLFDLPEPPERIEVYDNSHVSGAHAIGAMIVAGPEGFVKNAYRKFNIKGTRQGAAEAQRSYKTKDGSMAPGDDYAMMREVLRRRFARLANRRDRSAEAEASTTMAGQEPGLVIVDGGAGHLNIAREVLAEYGLEHIPVIGVAKGPERNAGAERIFMHGREPIELEPRDPLLYFLQRLRDEAHRFAIGTHRAKRSKAISRSPLDDIPGIGAKRKKALLAHFGSARSVATAGLKDLGAINGISDAVARTVYDYFHSER